MKNRFTDENSPTLWTCDGCGRTHGTVGGVLPPSWFTTLIPDDAGPLGHNRTIDLCERCADDAPVTLERYKWRATFSRPAR